MGCGWSGVELDLVEGAGMRINADAARKKLVSYAAVHVRSAIRFIFSALRCNLARMPIIQLTR